MTNKKDKYRGPSLHFVQGQDDGAKQTTAGSFGFAQDRLSTAFGQVRAKLRSG